MASRRDFLNTFGKPLVQTKEAPSFVVRPPYGFNESLFQSECVMCESKACVASCDEQIITISSDGTPTLDFFNSGCTFCEDCMSVCESGVLSLENRHTSEHINATFRISTQECVAHHGVICFSCKEPCIDDAILFNGMFNPVIDMQRCTGCGFCVGRCPAQAIEYAAIPIVQANTAME